MDDNDDNMATIFCFVFTRAPSKYIVYKQNRLSRKKKKRFCCCPKYACTIRIINLSLSEFLYPKNSNKENAAKEERKRKQIKALK